MRRDTLIVLSGGMDSVTMLHEYAPSIALAVNFSYGSNHNELERECARLHCARLGIELVEIDLGFMPRYFQSSLLEGADAIPSGEYAPENLSSTIVPFRNGIMLAIAAGLAENRGLQAVMIANHGGDHEIYPDCRPEFIRGMGHAIDAGTVDHIQLRAPYTLLSKAQIAQRGLRLGIDYSTTYSCYRGTNPPCGTCATCLERQNALEQAAAALAADK